MDKKIIEKAKEFQNKIAKQIANATGVPVFVADNNKINKLVDGIKTRHPDILKIYTESELHKEVSDFYIKFNIFPPKNQKEIDKRIMKFVNSLLTSKKYTAYIILKGIFDFPIGLKFGSIKFIKPDLRKKKFIEHIDYLNKEKKLGLDKPSSWNWIKVNFSSYKTKDIRDILYSELELFYAIISLLSHRDLDVKDNLGIIYSSNKSIYYLEPINQQNGWSKFREKDYLKSLKLLSKILSKTKKTKLENKVLNSLKVFGLSRQSNRIENRFLLLISAFESLLLSKNDKDYLGLKFAEKTAFLLLKKGTERRDLFIRLKKYYNMRSRLVHDGEAKMEKKDLSYLENVYLHLIMKIVDLSKKYDKMERKSSDKDKLGLEDYIEFLKFKINPKSLK